MFFAVLFAQPGRPAGSPLERPDIVWGSAGLAGALLVGAIVVYYVDRWRKRAVTEDTRQAGEELTGFRAMYERGEITEEEYNRLRLKVADRVKKAPTPAAGPAAPAGGTAPPGPAPGPAVPGPFPPGYFDDPPPNGSAPPGPPGGTAPPA
jgi:hypothetical protein